MVKKVIVIGLDGVSENVLAAVGWERLPNLKALLKEGTSGKLESVLPPMTAQAWATFATGKNPGKHGADNFFLPEGDLNTTKIVSSEDIAGKTVYEILEEAGRRCVLVNLPVAYPYRLKQGVSIASFLSGGDDWYWPAGLKGKIEGLEQYRLFPDTFLEFSAGREKYAHEVREIARVRFKVGQQLFEKEPWDLFFLLFSETDWIQHRELAALAAGKIPAESEVIKLYQEIDGYVGWFCKQTRKERVMILLSDHGFKVYRGRFYVNKWLAEQGWLTLSSHPGEQTQPQVVARTKLEKGGQEGILSSLFKMGGLAALNFPMLRKVTAKAFKFVSDKFPQQLQRDLTDFSDINVGCDPGKTKAYSMPGNFGAVYVNSRVQFTNGIVGRSETEKLKKEIKKGLEGLRDPLTGLPAVGKVYLREELYHGERLNQAPDVICEAGEFWIKPSVSVKEMFWHGPVASHCRTGILAVWDGKLKKKNLGRRKLEDLAPTILKWLEVPIPKEMDGKVFL